MRLESTAHRALLPDLPCAAEDEVELRVIGRVLALPSDAPTELQKHVRPLRPGLSIAHPSVTAGTLGGFVRSGDRLAVVSNNHVLAAGDAGAFGDPVLQPGPADGGTAADLARRSTDYVVKVDLAHPAVAQRVPGDVDGVRVVTEVVGVVRPL